MSQINSRLRTLSMAMSQAPKICIRATRTAPRFAGLLAVRFVLDDKLVRGAAQDAVLRQVFGSAESEILRISFGAKAEAALSWFVGRPVQRSASSWMGGSGIVGGLATGSV